MSYVMMLIAVAITMVLTVSMMKHRQITVGSSVGPSQVSVAQFNSSSHPETLIHSPEVDAANKAAAIAAQPQQVEKMDAPEEP
jgi:hypothetical protein